MSYRKAIRSVFQLVPSTVSVCPYIASLGQKSLGNSASNLLRSWGPAWLCASVPIDEGNSKPWPEKGRLQDQPCPDPSFPGSGPIPGLPAIPTGSESGQTRFLIQGPAFPLIPPSFGKQGLQAMAASLIWPDPLSNGDAGKRSPV